MKVQSSVQSSFQNLNVAIAAKKDGKLNITIFKSYQISRYFSLSQRFGYDCLRKEFIGRDMIQSPSYLNFGIFFLNSKHFSNHDGNIKRVSSLKSTKFNSFVLVLICFLGLGQSLTLEKFQLCGFVLF